MEDHKFVMVKGFIDGKDDKLAELYGVFLGVASQLETKYMKARFSRTPIDRRLEYPELLSLLRVEDEADEELHERKTSLERYIREYRLLQTSIKNMNNKAIEQQVNHFCSDTMKLRCVTFVVLEVMGDGDMALLAAGEQVKEPPDHDPNDEEAADEDGGEADDEDEEDETEEDDDKLFIALEPILDPVMGVATGELQVGERIVCRLPENSVYYRLFMSASPEFDGLMTGEVTKIKSGEFGTAVVGVSLTDGVSGVLKLAASVRVRLAGKDDSVKRRGVPWNGEKGIPLGFIFASVGVFLLLCFIGILLRFL